MGLDGKQRRKLRALGHHLGVVVQVGHEGVTAGVLAALEEALWDHELVKVKLASEYRDTREEQSGGQGCGNGAGVSPVAGPHRPVDKADPGRAAHRALTRAASRWGEQDGRVGTSLTGGGPACASWPWWCCCWRRRQARSKPRRRRPP